MMGLIRGWLLEITAAAILAALAESMMPEGGVKQVGKLVCGLMLAAAVLRPFGSVEVTDLAPLLEYDAWQSQVLQEEAEGRMKTIIEEDLSAYSMDKAAQLGFPCRIRVTCRLEEAGVFLPASAEIVGVPEVQGRQIVAEFLCADLGLSSTGLVFREEGEE